MIENINTFNRWNQVLTCARKGIAGIRDCCIRQQSHIFLLFLLFVFIASNFVSSIYALGLPHPPDSELIEEGTGQYRSLLTQGEILRFYQQKLTGKGWKRIDVPLQQASGFNSLNRTFNFVKGSDTLTLTFSPFTAEGFVFYTISAGEPSETGSPAEAQELSSDDMFKKPESLDFMPLYPGSKQIDYSKTSSGLRAGYSATGGVETVKGFYLQKMPQKGWNLVDQQYMGGDEYDLSRIDSADCPTCPKIPLEAKEAMAKIDMKGVTLEFQQGSKTCVVNIIEMGGFEGVDLTSSGLGDTIITIVYDDK